MRTMSISTWALADFRQRPAQDGLDDLGDDGAPTARGSSGRARRPCRRSPGPPRSRRTRAGPEGRAARSRASRRRRTADPEVQEDHLALSVEHEVAGVHVAMEEAVLEGRLEPGPHLSLEHRPEAHPVACSSTKSSILYPWIRSMVS